MAAVLTHCRDFLDGIHRHQEQNHRDDWAAQGFNHSQDAWVQRGDNPGRNQHEQRSDFVQLVDFDGFAFAAQRLDNHSVETFTSAQVVAEEGFRDGDNRDDRRHPGDNWRVKVVRQVRQNRDVLLFRRRQVRWRQAQYATEDEEHNGQHHHDVSECQDLRAFLLSRIAVLFTLRDREGGDDRRVVEREHHYRNCQPQRHPQTIAGRGSGIKGERFQRCAAPLRDQVQGQQHQGRNKREYQNTHRFNDHLLTEAHDGHHADNQDQRQNRARRRGDGQLVGHEAFHGVGNRHTVNQQNRVNREEVEQGDQFTRANTEVLFNHFSDVFARVFTGQHEASQATVCEEGHRESDNRHDDQRDHTADACVNWQEQYARADCRAVKAQHPHGVRLAPSASRINRSNSAGLSGFHLFLLEEAKSQVCGLIQ
ncbi:hypothetical protein CKO_04153 [Citrobacter koseri ATCC BAA-895]|uniref:Uncharacterized protein n=1 Tax=Citrobacter koseri (strain ATCC BAA-895 / CDC 4225-83 / SGSC4696) TaxID=290338 RepID=A8AP04_CITK8|nr:hypothetical protein CKO_04153 [Citrobacter koseri ATCC BAA-895]